MLRHYEPDVGPALIDPDRMALCDQMETGIAAAGGTRSRLLESFCMTCGRTSHTNPRPLGELRHDARDPQVHDGETPHDCRSQEGSTRVKGYDPRSSGSRDDPLDLRICQLWEVWAAYLL